LMIADGVVLIALHFIERGVKAEAKVRELEEKIREEKNVATKKSNNSDNKPVVDKKKKSTTPATKEEPKPANSTSSTPRGKAGMFSNPFVIQSPAKKQE